MAVEPKNESHEYLTQESSSDTDDATWTSSGTDEGDDELEEGHIAFSLFDNFQSTSTLSVWNHMLKKYQFGPSFSQNLPQIPAQWTEYIQILVVNYLRYAGPELALQKWKELQNDPEPCLHSEYLMPQLPDDPLLWDEVHPIKETTEIQNLTSSKTQTQPLNNTSSDEIADATKVNNLSTTPSEKLEAFFTDKSYHEGPEPIYPESFPVDTFDKDRIPEWVHSVRENDKHVLTNSKCLMPSQSSTTHEDKQYFENYDHLDIHRTMIQDRTRTEAYRTFILRHQQLFKDKVVLDVGCGTSILSLFCAQAGAKKVIGIDAAPSVSKVAQKVIKENGYENIIQILTGKVEKHQLFWHLPSQSVHMIDAQSLPLSENDENYKPFHCDILVSEWMGYGLFSESMIYTVLQCRNLYLKPDGFLVPSHVHVGVCGVDLSSYLFTELDFCKFQYGLDLSSVAPNETAFLRHPAVMEVDPCHIRTQLQDVCVINMKHVSKKQIQQLQFPIELEIFPYSNQITSLCLYFDCYFTPDQSLECNSFPVLNLENSSLENLEHTRGIKMSTSPLSTMTHWKQTILHITNSEGLRACLMNCQSSDGKRSCIKATVHMNEYGRSVCITVLYSKCSCSTASPNKCDLQFVNYYNPL